MFHKVRIKEMVRFLMMAVVCCYCQVVGFAQTGEAIDLGKPRTWTATTGHKLDATYLGREGNKIRLSLNNGQVRTVLLENLSEADRQLVNNQGQEEKGGANAVIPNGGRAGAGKHAYMEFLADAKQKRLGREEGVEYYQNVIAALYKQIEEYEFKYPQDFIKEDNSFNTKYLNKIVERKKPVAERRNLFTGKLLATPVYANEPKWESVSQEVNYAVYDHIDSVWIEQCDVLYAGSNEKIVKFGCMINRKARSEAKYEASYMEDGKNFIYAIPAFVELEENGSLILGGKKDDWVKLHSHDLRKGIFYTLNILIDRDGKVTIQNSEEGSFQFFASTQSKTNFLYPRKKIGDYFFVRDSQKFSLGRYDLNGILISQESLWAEAASKNWKEFNKPSVKHDDPLNVFTERHIKDK